ncbi:MAG: hypothetical protein JNM00_06600, partial [Flavobacteriales bacterium]|nr:hypothetical protein [Flavobacteriales bacterium]
MPATSSFTLDIDPQFVEVPGTVYTWTIPAIPQPIVAYNPPPVVVSQAGIFTVNITSVDLQGLITSHDQQVTITEPAFPFTIVEQNGLTITVQTLFPLVPMFDYFLSFDGGITNIALPPNGILNITVPDFGTYDLSLTVYNELSFQIGPITWLPVDILEFCTSPLIPNFAFSISDTVSCGGITTLSASLVLNGDESDYCMDIDWGDGSASSINYTALFGLWTIHFYECEGTYEVEVTIRCCDYPNSFAYKTNHVITVVCDCQLPTASSIDIITSTGLDDPCNVITACIEPISDPSSLADTDLCVIYDWGDGSSPENAYPGQCPSHNYNCNGTYTITASVFCCGNICESFIIEKEVVVNCACNIEELDAVTWIVSTEDCTINGSFLLGQCFDGKCLNWDWGDESATEEMTASEDGNAFSHTYGAS